MKKNFYNNNLNEYCRVCDRNWWTKDMCSISHNAVILLREAGYPQMFSKIEDECTFYNCCRNCKSMLSRNRIPQLATINGFVYPSIHLICHL